MILPWKIIKTNFIIRVLSDFADDHYAIISSYIMNSDGKFAKTNKAYCKLYLDVIIPKLEGHKYLLIRYSP